MGEVYEARHQTTDESAAVKLLRREVLGEGGIVARFEREAELIQDIGSEHVVRVLEIGGPSAALPFIAMERLQGDDLANRLQKHGALSPSEALELITQACAGLQVVHERGIVHRDLKPQNLFRSRGPEGNRWKILDFGVSTLINTDHGLTGGLAVGTPNYMSPEQAVGGAVDGRTDLYALGCIAYRALTNQPAFSAPTIGELFHKIATQLPEHPGNNEGLRPELVCVLRIALAKDPAERFGTAEEFQAAFRAAVEGRLPAKYFQRAKALDEVRTWHMPPGAYSEHMRYIAPTVRKLSLGRQKRMEAKTLPH